MYRGRALFAATCSCTNGRRPNGRGPPLGDGSKRRKAGAAVVLSARSGDKMGGNRVTRGRGTSLASFRISRRSRTAGKIDRMAREMCSWIGRFAHSPVRFVRPPTLTQTRRTRGMLGNVSRRLLTPYSP